jgi:2-C-methyl-D-erythritol 4-phosphate cytidylyltransferase
MGLSCKKPYIPLCGEPLLVHTLRAFIRVPEIGCIIIAVFPGEEQLCREKIVSHLPRRDGIIVVPGGGTRQESVRSALSRVPDDCRMVMIHDGARPMISEQIISAALRETLEKQATTAAVTVKDTTAVVSDSGMTIAETLPREKLISIQTPQTFIKEIVVRAHERAEAEGFSGTDDASLVSRLGLPVYIVTGSHTNIKITTREDLLFAEMLLGRRQDELSSDRPAAGERPLSGEV